MKPGPPVNLQAIDFTKESVTLSWEPPTDTGRGKIFGYLLEFQKAGEEEWHKVRKLLKTSSFLLINLMLHLLMLWVTWDVECLCFCGHQVNQTPDSCQETKFKVINLEDGALYRFRVMAVNAAGESDPANIKEPIRVQDRLGDLSFKLHIIEIF